MFARMTKMCMKMGNVRLRQYRKLIITTIKKVQTGKLSIFADFTY